MVNPVLVSSVESELRAAGLRLIGHTTFQSFEEDRKHLERWQSEGLFADMHYMSRPSSLLSDPKNLMSEGVSIISVAMDYGSGAHSSSVKKGYGKVARYAWGVDYHLAFREALTRVAEVFKKFGATKAFTDAVPLLERAVAKRGSDVGFIGKNTLFIQPKMGSLFFLGEILCSFPLIEDRELQPTKESSCKSCSRCSTQCPTGALDTFYSLDASKCISYLTIEHRSMFSTQQVSAVDNWIFGCDICQEVCPFNYVTIKRKISAHASLVPTPIVQEGMLAIDSVLQIESENQFRKVFYQTPFLRTRRKGLIRNGLAVSYNQGYVPSHLILKKLLEDKDLFVAKCAGQFITLSHERDSQLSSLYSQAVDRLNE